MYGKDKGWNGSLLRPFIPFFTCRTEVLANLNASYYVTLLSLPKPFGVTCHIGMMVGGMLQCFSTTRD